MGERIMMLWYGLMTILLMVLIAVDTTRDLERKDEDEDGE